MEDVQEILRRIESIEKKQDDVIIGLNELTTAWPYIVRRLDQIEKVIYGNGDGIIAKVASFGFISSVVVAIIAAGLTAIASRLM